MKTVPLGEIVEVVSGATPKTGVTEYWGGNIQWATPADLSKLHGPYIRRTPRTLTELGVRSCATTVLPAGSVLLSSRAPIGHVAINAVPMATNQGFKSLVPGSEVDAKYLYHWLKSKKEYLQSLGNGATFKELSKRATEQIHVPLPLLDEQRRIAAILDHADALRARRRQVRLLLDRLIQAIYEDVSSEVCEEPVAAGEVMPSMRNGLSPASNGRYAATVLTLSAITRGRFDGTAVKPAVFSVDPPSEKRVSADDFLMCRGNGNKALVGAGVVAPTDRSDLVFPDTVIAGRVDTAKVVLPYLEIAWRQPEVRSQIERAARTTSGIHKVNQQTLSAVMIPLPSLAVQETFAERRQRVDAAMDRVVQAARADDEFFASLQSRAFRGEL